MPVVTPARASIASQKAVPYCDVFSALIGHSEADQAASILGHEVDGFGRDLLGGESDVAFVLAVFIVDYDDHAAGAELLDGSRDIGEGFVIHGKAIVAKPVYRLVNHTAAQKGA